MLLITSANFHAFTPLSKQQLTPLLKHKLNILSQLEQQAGMVRSWTAKSQERAPPDPIPSKGIHKSTLMKFVSTRAAQGARGGLPKKVKTKTLCNLCSQAWPAAPQVNKTWLPCLQVLPGLHAEPQGRCWTGWHWSQTACKTRSYNCFRRVAKVSGQGALGEPGQPGVNFTGSRQP
eukprot:1157328-Pelagomonas_calceolata.AAC.5